MRTSNLKANIHIALFQFVKNSYVKFLQGSVATFLGEVGKFYRTLWLTYPRHCVSISIKLGQGWPKKVSYILCCIFQRIRNIFKNSFTVILSRKFAIKRSLQIPPHLNGVATLPCEILMSENSVPYMLSLCGTVF